MRGTLLLVPVLATFPFLVSPPPSVTPPAPYDPEKLVAASVLVKAEGGTGSGVCFRNGGRSLIWTDAHVVEGGKSVARVVDAGTGLEKVVVRFLDVELWQEQYEGGRKVGHRSVLAKVIRYSEHHDLALLLPCAPFPEAGVCFLTANEMPRPGESLWHVGSMHGARGLNSVSAGVFSLAGRLRKGFSFEEKDDPVVFDQACLPILPGSSGGGVFRQRDGACIGLVSQYLGRGPTPSIFLMTPARRLREFARAVKCEWAVDASVPVPENDPHPVFCDPYLPLPEPEAP